MASELDDLVSLIFETTECSGTSSSEDQSAGVACSSPPTDVFQNLTITDHVNRGMAVENEEPHLNYLPESHSNPSHIVNDYNNQPRNPNEFHRPRHLSHIIVNDYNNQLGNPFHHPPSVHQLCSGCVATQNGIGCVATQNGVCCVATQNGVGCVATQNGVGCVATQNGGVFPQNGFSLPPNNNNLSQNYNIIPENYQFVQQSNTFLPLSNFDPQNVMNTHQSTSNCNSGACSSTSMNDGAIYRTDTVQNELVCSKSHDPSQHVNIFHCPMLQNPTTAGSNPRQTRTRTKFTQAHLDVLEREFIAKQFISRIRRLELANQLNLNDKVIKVWFQNRRMRNKRQQFVEDT